MKISKSSTWELSDSYRRLQVITGDRLQLVAYIVPHTYRLRYHTRMYLQKGGIKGDGDTNTFSQLSCWCLHDFTTVGKYVTSIQFADIVISDWSNGRPRVRKFHYTQFVVYYDRRIELHFLVLFLDFHGGGVRPFSAVSLFFLRMKMKNGWGFVHTPCVGFQVQTVLFCGRNNKSHLTSLKFKFSGLLKWDEWSKILRFPEKEKQPIKKIEAEESHEYLLMARASVDIYEEMCLETMLDKKQICIRKIANKEYEHYINWWSQLRSESWELNI